MSSRECALMLEILAPSGAGREPAQQIMDTFEVDCTGISWVGTEYTDG